MEGRAEGKREVEQRQDVEGLRGVAVAAVVCFHYWPQILPAGYLGVDVFLVMSGFVVSRIILAEQDAGIFSFLAFLRRRARRLLPSLGLLLFAVLLLGCLLLLSRELVELARYLLASLGFVANWLAFADTGYFDGLASEKPLLHLWSLGVEGQFYLLLPWLLLIAVWRIRLWGLVLLLSMLASWLCSQYWRELDFYGIGTRIWEFEGGVGLALLEVSRWRDRWGRARRRLGWVGGLLLAAAFIGVAGWNGEFASRLTAVAATVLILWAANASGLGEVLAMAPGRFAGRLSYPLYLWHWPLWVYFGMVIGRSPSTGERFGLLLAGVAMASLSLLLERRLREGGWRYAGPGGLAALSWGGLALLGMLLLGSGGWPGRGRVYQTPEGVTWEAGAEASCRARFNTPAGYCFLSGAGRGVVAVLGDSHANALAEGLRLHYGSSRPVLNLGGPGCPMLAGVGRNGGREQAACLPLAEQALSFVESQSEVSLVILSGRYGYYLENGLLTVSPDGFRAALAASVRRLQVHGKHVVLVHPVPETGSRFSRQCGLVRPFAPAQEDGACLRDRSAVEKAQSLYRQALAGIDRELPDLQFIDPMAVFCNGTGCSSLLDTQPLYRDADHLNAFGASLLATRLPANW